MFLGWIMVLIVDECVAVSLGELASRYPTSAGPYYWSFQLANKKWRKLLSFVTGWTWLIGNWTITLSVNFGFASLIVASISLYHPDFAAEPWQLLLIFYAICLVTFVICAYGNKMLPMVDTICAAFTAISILITLICLAVKADVGRHSAVSGPSTLKQCTAGAKSSSRPTPLGITTKVSAAGVVSHSSSASFQAPTLFQPSA